MLIVTFEGSTNAGWKMADLVFKNVFNHVVIDHNDI